VHSFPSASAFKGVKLKFLVAASAALGVVWFEFVSGTTNIKRDPDFLVGSGKKELDVVYKVSHHSPRESSCTWVCRQCAAAFGYMHGSASPTRPHSLLK